MHACIIMMHKIQFYSYKSWSMWNVHHTCTGHACMGSKVYHRYICAIMYEGTFMYFIIYIVINKWTKNKLTYACNVWKIHWSSKTNKFLCLLCGHPSFKVFAFSKMSKSLTASPSVSFNLFLYTCQKNLRWLSTRVKYCNELVYFTKLFKRKNPFIF